jgi:hypothetical protein
MSLLPIQDVPLILPCNYTGTCPLVPLAPDVYITQNNQSLAAQHSWNIIKDAIQGLKIATGIDTYRKSS